MTSFYEQLAAASKSGVPFALGLIGKATGSSPQKSGAKAVFFSDGRILGTLGGGCLEAEIQDRARRALLSGEPATFDLLLDHDFGWDDGLICGGRVRGMILPRAAAAASLWSRLAHPDAPVSWGVKSDFSIAPIEGSSSSADEETWRYRETVRPLPHLWIAGTGHIAQAVAPLAHQLDFRVTVFDDRATFANPNHFPGEITCRVGPWEALLQQPAPAGPLFGLIVTRGHQRDALVLRDWIHRPFAFLGMIGSRRKWRLISDQFVADGLASAAELERVACPVGLPLGGTRVMEIAVSILAQFVERRASLAGG